MTGQSPLITPPGGSCTAALGSLKLTRESSSASDKRDGAPGSLLAPPTSSPNVARGGITGSSGSQTSRTSTNTLTASVSRASPGDADSSGAGGDEGCTSESSEPIARLLASLALRIIGLTRVSRDLSLVLPDTSGIAAEEGPSSCPSTSDKKTPGDSFDTKTILERSLAGVATTRVADAAPSSPGSQEGTPTAASVISTTGGTPWRPSTLSLLGLLPLGPLPVSTGFETLDALAREPRLLALRRERRSARSVSSMNSLNVEGWFSSPDGLPSSPEQLGYPE